MNLYDVTTTVKKYRSWKNVKFIWFRCERAAPRPYADLVENYDPSIPPYAEDYIDGLFELDEAEALKRYLDQHHGDEGITTIKKTELPVANNVVGVGAIGAGGGEDYYRLDDEPGYSLPFKVWGYFNLVGCELADGSGETFGDFFLREIAF